MLDAITPWDWFVLIVAVLSIGIGLVRGLVRTVFAVAAWGVGLACPTCAAKYVWC